MPYPAVVIFMVHTQPGFAAGLFLSGGTSSLPLSPAANILQGFYFAR